MRYDAKIKEYPELIQYIEKNFSVIAVCPEVEIGLSVPRPAVQLYGDLNAIKIRGRDDQCIDITNKMAQYCQQRSPQLGNIHGYIFKSKSPSCGTKDIPIFNEAGVITNTSKGVFVSSILQHYPNLPITDELDLMNYDQYEHFLMLVKHDLKK